MAAPPNKQFEPTVMPQHVRAASATLHYALAARWTAQRAAAQLRRYAAPRLLRGIFVRSMRPLAVTLALTFMVGCAPAVRVDMDYNATNSGTSAAVGTWRNQRLRFFRGEYADAVNSERRMYIATALHWLDRQDAFACPDEELYVVQREDIWAVEFMERGELFIVFVGCCDGYYFAKSSEEFSCTGRGEYLRIS